MKVNVVIKNSGGYKVYDELLNVKTENEAVIKVMEKELIGDGDIIEIEVVEY